MNLEMQELLGLVRSNRHKEVREWFEKGHPFDLRADPHPLTEATTLGLWDTVRALVEGGVSIATADTMGNTPLHVAAQSGSLVTLDLIVALGHPLDPANHRGMTPLLMAIQHGDPAMVLALARLGASLDSLDPADGGGVFHKAVKSEHSAKCLDALLEVAPWKRDERDRGGKTPLARAIREGVAEAVLRLIETGASLEAESGGWDALRVQMPSLVDDAALARTRFEQKCLEMQVPGLPAAARKRV